MFEDIRETLKEVRLTAINNSENAKDRAKAELATRGIKSDNPLKMLRTERDGYNHESRFSTAAMEILAELDR